MRAPILELTVTELQQALRDYAEKHAVSQPDEVHIANGFGKVVLTVPLCPGSVVRGCEFQRQTEVD